MNKTLKYLAMNSLISVFIAIVASHYVFKYEIKHSLATANTQGFLFYSDQAAYKYMEKPLENEIINNKGLATAIADCVEGFEEDLGVIVFEYGAISSSAAAIDLTPNLKKCLVDKGYSYLSKVNIDE